MGKKQNRVVKVTITTDRYYTQDALSELACIWEDIVVDKIKRTKKIKRDHFDVVIDVDNTDVD